MCYQNIDTLAVSKDEWDTKEDTGNSMRMHCTYCGIPKKRHLSGRSDIIQCKKIKHIALAVIELHLSEGISQKFHRDLLKVFWVNLKACLGLV